ncbi:MAG: hypothetical protein CL920_12225 [Deltaproteobacteria bacterium]|nr:hypothetical protein [Deltaproteobacteria bacterium]MBU49452.1 hypothetical protein [Deltaproteobacteria bacterium]|tara:strand:- start:30402 stop:31253 length:852 start_codon:yes stop_codon:yes gene_type:complete
MYTPIPFHFEADQRFVQLETMGKGPSLLVIVGGPGLSHRYLSPYLHALAEDFTLYVYDQTGCGRSETLPESEHYTLHRERLLMQQLLAYCKRTNPEHPVYIMGHSFGALQVMGLLCESRDNIVDKAILMTSMPIYQTPKDNALLTRLLRLRPDMKDRYFALNRIRRKRPWTKAEQNEAVAVGLSGGLIEPDRIFELDFDYNPIIVEHFALEYPSYDLRERAAGVTLPIHVIAGKHDFFTLDKQQDIANAFPNASLDIFEESAHFPFFEQPTRFTQSVRDFLKS